MVDRELLCEVLADFPRTLVEEHSVSDVLDDLVEYSTKVVGVAGAGVSLVEGRVTTSSAERMKRPIPESRAHLESGGVPRNSTS